MQFITKFAAPTVVALAMFVAFVPSATFASDMDFGDLGGGLGGWDSYDYGGFDSYDYGYGSYDYGSDPYNYGGYDSYDYGSDPYGYGYDSYDYGSDPYGYGYDPYDYGNSYYEESSYHPYGYGSDPYYEESSYFPYTYDSYGGSTGGGLFNWTSQPVGYSSGGCYSCGGGGSYSTPKYSTGGGFYTVAPKSVAPVKFSGGGGGGSQSQNQSQSQVSNNTNTNTNTNININSATAIAVAQVPASYAAPSYPAPYCTITHAQSYGNYGYGHTQPITLSWHSTNAQSAYLSGYGSVAVSGSRVVYGAQTYTLTVYGSGGSSTCQTTVYGGGTYTPPTYTPTTPYVALTQIPYTGFDFGPFGNAMYWAGLAILAIGGAYLAVYFIPQLAFARSSYKRTFAPVVAPKAPILVEKEIVEAKVAPIVASLKRSGTNDSMAIVQKSGSMPKIVIDRS